MWYKVNNTLGSMDSFLITAKDKVKATQTWQELCKKEKIGKFDVSIIEPEKPVGIGDIRDVQKKLYLKPLQSPKKAVILDATTGITVDAQNALLKSLEEPPDNTIIILIAKDKESVLPTIISRCKLIDLNAMGGLVFDEKEKKTYEKLLDELQKADTGEKLKMAQDFGKNKEEAALWSEKMILVIREKMLEAEGDRKSFLVLLKEFESANKILKTSNANPRLTLENLFFSI